ncbi:MAG: hypothetical protein CL877_00955 [Dehalococcoidales bacterium]|jgi:uncharacterized membrane protein|nr:hypothetical protein [Dehalococcoidales bacterium]|tara:strand:- start:2834 stop:3445 length:612 start_codon:yes stop_codon:yes gene_type:complete
MSLRNIYGILFALLFLAYPALVYFGTLHYSPRIVSLIIILCLIVRLFSSSANRLAKIVFPATLIGLTLCVVSALLDNEVYIQYLPVIYSGLFFLAFGSTILHPPSMIEVFARAIAPSLSPKEVSYCKTITFIWILFFAINGLISAITVCCATFKFWAYYNGLISYILMFLIFASEFLYRHWKFRKYVGLPTDRFLKKIFPPIK